VRKVICSALQAYDGSILLGIRHYSKDMHDQIEARKDGEKFYWLHDKSQGFVDQHGIYMTREEAYLVAVEASQIPEREVKLLYSEDLY